MITKIVFKCKSQRTRKTCTKIININKPPDLKKLRTFIRSEDYGALSEKDIHAIFLQNESKKIFEKNTFKLGYHLSYSI